MKKLFKIRYLSLVLFSFIYCTNPTQDPTTQLSDVDEESDMPIVIEGNVLHLNGDKQYFRIPDLAELNLGVTNAFTIEMWVNPERDRMANLINKLQIFEKGYIDNSDTILPAKPPTPIKQRGWFTDIFAPDTSLNTGKPYPFVHTRYSFREENGTVVGRGTGQSKSDKGIIPDEWIHLAIIYNGQGIRRVYVNGWSRGYSDGSRDNLSTPGYSLNLGGYPNTEEFSENIDMYFNGKFDEVRIWDHAIDSLQIETNWNKAINMDVYSSPDSGLIGYYKFEDLENLGIGTDGNSNDIRDHSYKQNHGEVIGGGILEKRN